MALLCSVAVESRSMPVSSGSTYHIGSEDLVSIQKNADGGCLESALKLYKFYSFSNYDAEKASYWLEKSATLGDPIAQYNYSLSLFDAGNEL